MYKYVYVFVYHLYIQQQDSLPLTLQGNTDYGLPSLSC